MMGDLIEREAAAKLVEQFGTAAHIAHSIKTDAFPEQTDIRDAIADAIRALPAVTVAVKPLIWGDDNDVCSSALTSIGEYVVQIDGGVWRVWPCDWQDDTGEEYPTIEAAKAAAQADYDARIRAALDVAPVSLAEAARVPEIAALIEAAKRVWNEACANHDKEPPTKYMAPYGGLVAVHNALRAIAGGTE